MAVVVQKYGGTSVGTIEKIKAVAKKVIDRKEQGNEIVVVVSAMGKTTDSLITMAKEISPNPDKRELDMLVSTGEQISIALLSMAFHEYGYDSISLTGFQAGIKTDGLHTKNRITDIDIKNVKKNLHAGRIVVVAGFQGINENGDITTLGRGGSDTTAVALAAKLKCACEIYTDVEGVYSVDPRVYPKAKKLHSISYEEMMEMASLGAGVMETRAVELGFKYNIPIYVAMTHGNKKGTVIKEYDDTMEGKVITGLTLNDDVLMITVNNVEYKSKNIARIFDKVAKHNINIDMISQTAPFEGYVNVSFTCSTDDSYSMDAAASELQAEIPGIEVSKESDITKLSVVGIGMMKQSGVAAKVFNIFSDNNIEFKQVTTSEISISYTINSSDKQKAVNALAEALDLKA
ncbi:MAG TPA: aspartate kinase [Patescibacteria group bacterium]|jgi:aspartate kinase|nr:aspartate kinase [Patescibacteria group bacterium]